MLKDENNIDKKCEQYDINTIIDIIDGNIHDDAYLDMLKHIESCDNCRMLYNQIKISQNILKKAKESKENYINNISLEYKKEKIDIIKQKLKEKEKEKENENEVVNNKKSVRTIPLINYFSKLNNNIFNNGNLFKVSSTAAIFVVMILVIYIFSKSFFLTKTGTDSKEMYGTNQKDASASIYMDGIQETADGNTKNEGVSERDVNNSIDSSYTQSTVKLDEVIVLPQLSKEINEILLLSAYNIIIKNDENNYQNISCISKDQIVVAQQKLLEIISNSKISAKIEIISGENSEKLIEYTSKENIANLRDIAVLDKADFLIISIGR